MLHFKVFRAATYEGLENQVNAWLDENKPRRIKRTLVLDRGSWVVIGVFYES